jgi:hypothetical protein
MIKLESIPTTWDCQAERFFRMTAAVFPPEFGYGATVLLASYDTDDASGRGETETGTPAGRFDRMRAVVTR